MKKKLDPAAKLVRTLSSIRLRMDNIWSTNGTDTSLWAPALREEHLDLFLKEIDTRNAMMRHVAFSSRLRKRSQG